MEAALLEKAVLYKQLQRRTAQDNAVAAFAHVQSNMAMQRHEHANNNNSAPPYPYTYQRKPDGHKVHFGKPWEGQQRDAHNRSGLGNVHRGPQPVLGTVTSTTDLPGRSGKDKTRKQH